MNELLIAVNPDPDSRLPYQRPDRLQEVPGHRLDIQQIPLTVRPTLHPKIIPALEDQQAEADRLFSGNASVPRLMFVQ
jgi:hypothetical protein